MKPQNVVQAAKEDIKRRERNEARADPETPDIRLYAIRRRYGEDYEQYAFLRQHVCVADGAFGLIQLALDSIVKPKDAGQLADKIARSTKKSMRHIYVAELLRAALEMEKRS